MAALDHLLAPLHPERLFLGRHKFTHFRLWYRDVLSEHVRETLLDPDTLSLPYVARKRVEALVEAHLAGLGNYTVEIHKLLTIELVHRLFARARTQTPSPPPS
jgi:asparagine synthase (glutamine-hydrolysing)